MGFMFESSYMLFCCWNCNCVLVYWFGGGGGVIGVGVVLGVVVLWCRKWVDSKLCCVL